MPFDKEKALADIDRVLKQVDRELPTDRRSKLQELTMLINAGVERWAPPASAYRRRISDLQKAGPFAPGISAGVLRALRADIEADALQTLEEQVHADLFSDLLAQAEHLNGEGWRRAAAVLAGGALEEHLRQLADKHGIETHDSRGAPRQASALNADLYKADAYSKAENAEVDSWQKRRNAAAHGEPGFEDEHDKADVRRMIEGVRAFIGKHPA